MTQSPQEVDGLPGARPRDLGVTVPEVPDADLDLTRFVDPGDTIIWTQGAAEPLALTKALARQAGDLRGVTGFCGVTYSSHLAAVPAEHLTLRSYGALGTTVSLAREARLGVIPAHLSELPRLFENGVVACDVVMIQVSPAGKDGYHSLGVGIDYVANALVHARTILAEVNDQMPRTCGPIRVPGSSITARVETSRPLISVPSTVPDGISRAIAKHMAGLIPDGATLQFGIGKVPDAVASLLRGRRNLGVHSGVITDAMVDLFESGAVSNARKGIDIGVTVTGTAFGTNRLYQFVRDNPKVVFQPASYTHNPLVLCKLSGLVAINSALEVDLTGQVNAECVNGAYVGAVGGQVDFSRGAALSPGGLSIIALPSTTAQGRSRIVPRLGDAVVTTTRADVDFIVTEHGVAALRGRTLAERARALIAIADPRFQEELARAA